MTRPSKNNYYLEIAKAVALRSTCLRKAYGAIIVKNDRIIATGYNGVPAREPHCFKCTKCGNGKDEATYLSCKSVHAEQNALLGPSREEMLGADLYLAGYDIKTGEAIEINAIPCEICFRLLKNSGIEKVISRDGVCAIRGEDGILRRV